MFGGQPRQVFERAVQEGQRIIVSAELLSEVRRVLGQRFPDFLPDFEALLAALEHFIVSVALGSVTITICRDPDDNKILETAVIGRAACLISGDKDLLTLHPYEAIQIVRPSEYLL